MPSPHIVAHRGASVDAPENTLPAFRLAWEQGADAIEGDFRLTRDGHLVCIHDETTKQTAERALVVADSTLEELRELDVGSWKGETFTDTRIPTLTEVLALVPAEKQLFLEVKCGPEAVPVLTEVLAATGTDIRRLRIIAFDPRVVRAAKTALPEVAVSLLVNRVRNRAGPVEPTLECILETLRDTGADGLGTGRKHVGAELIQSIRAAGVSHHVWTVDDPREALDFHRAGTVSITTNVPGRMREAFPRP